VGIDALTVDFPPGGRALISSSRLKNRPEVRQAPPRHALTAVFALGCCGRIPRNGSTRNLTQRKNFTAVIEMTKMNTLSLKRQNGAAAEIAYVS